MKTRAETKGSILNKSRLIKTQRIRRLHQLAVSSGAACAAAICLWTAASAATRIKKAPSELVTGGYSADSFTGDAMKGDEFIPRQHDDSNAVRFRKDNCAFP